MIRKEKRTEMIEILKRVLVFVVLLAFAMPAWSQTKEEEEEKGNLGNQEVNMNTTKNIMVNDANKIKENPKPKDTIYQAPNFDYIIREMKLYTPFKIVPIKAAKMKGQPLEKLYSNYIAAGMGTRATPYGEFFHSKTRSRYLNYGIHGKHLSSSADIDNYDYPGYSNTIGEAYVNRFGKVNAIRSSVKYKRESVHNYGFRTDSIMVPMIFPAPEMDFKQVYHTANANFTYYRYRPKRKDMNYAIGGDYTFFTDHFSNMQHTAKIDAFADFHVEFVKGFDNQRLGFSVKDNFILHQFEKLSSNTVNVVEIAPYYKFEAKILKAEVGFKTNITSDTISEIHFYPKIHLEIEGINDILYLSFDLDGGIYPVNYMKMVSENPFVIPYTGLDLSEKTIGFTFGLETAISKRINLSVGVDYQNWKNGIFFVNDTVNFRGNYFNYVKADYDRVKLSTAISYQLKDHLSIMLDGEYNIYNMQVGGPEFAWHKPDYEIALRAKYNLQDKILFSADVIAYGKSMARKYNSLGEETSVELKGWVDANIGIEYRFNKKLGAFVKVHNIANAKYQRWNQYPTYGFSIMAGASYIF